MAIDRIRGSTDIPLSSYGEMQAQTIGDKLPQLSRIYTSHLQRTLATAKAVQEKTGGMLHIVPDLRDMHYGIFEGKPSAEVIHHIHNFITRDPDTPIPGVSLHSGEPGESFNTYKKRIMNNVNTLLKYADKHPKENIGIVLNRRSVNTINSILDNDPSLLTTADGAKPGDVQAIGRHKNLWLIRHGSTLWNEEDKTNSV